MTFDRAARVAAGVVAAVAWFGLAVQFQASYAEHGTVLGTLWSMLRFFTIIGNGLVALAFTLVALGQPTHPSTLGAVTIAIVLVGTVYFTLLGGRVGLRGPGALANLVIHGIVPVLVPLYWLVFVPRGALRHHHPLLWAAVPLVYLAYMLTRGQIESAYPYPFLDVGQIGWPRTAENAAGIAVAFLLFGFVMVWLDWLLAWRTRGH